MHSLLSVIVILYSLCATSVFASENLTSVQPVVGDAFGKIVSVEGELRVSRPYPESKIDPIYTVLDIAEGRGGKQISVICIGYDKALDDFIMNEAKQSLGRYNVIGYESLDVRGIPAGIEKYVQMVAETNFEISNMLIVLKLEKLPGN